jgi:hypothetical protein
MLTNNTTVDVGIITRMTTTRPSRSITRYERRERIVAPSTPRAFFFGFSRKDSVHVGRARGLHGSIRNMEQHRRRQKHSRMSRRDP